MTDLSTERIDALLSDLDFIARDYDVYEYGLPLHGADEQDGPINKLRAAVREWDVVKAAQELVDYEQTGAPDYPLWDEKFDALRAALEGRC